VSHRLALVPPGVSPFRLGYRPCLDGLRGLAAVLVVAAHLRLLPGGFVGVEALFVLSGFLITVMLIEERERRGAINLGRFFRRRFLRVLPPFVALLVFGSLIGALLGFRKPREMMAEVVPSALFVSNLNVFATPLPTFGHTWTLALEVQFYFVWPVALYVLLRANVSRSWIVRLAVAGIVASAGLRLLLFLQRPPNGPEQFALLMRLFFAPLTHSDGLFVGCLAGLLVVWNRLPDTEQFRARLRWVGWGSLAGLAYLAARFHHEKHGAYCGGFTLTALLVAVLIVWLITDPPRPLVRVLESRPLVGLGRISYALYLFHMPICYWLEPRSPGAIVLVVGLSVGAAVLSFYLLERPLFGSTNRAATPAESVEPVATRRAA
jgi:peptidoglycan/LPS O-acetylase OafA/YrhL